LTLFDNLIGKRARMQGELFIGGKQFTAFLFQQPFSGKSRTPFPSQPFHNVHTRFALSQRLDIRARPSGAIPVTGTLKQQDEATLNGNKAKTQIANPCHSTTERVTMNILVSGDFSCAFCSFL
ncbi:MAG: hypothetical protein U1D06_11430, partial [Paracoccaceae bacterium]|nr:hypothetical protein [Paracoccaceae bacterium]